MTVDESVWLAYLSANWLATYSLSVLSRSQGGSESNGTSSNTRFIPAFWAPMLLVHVGGPDAITAYSVEDNEFWSRHLLQLLTQLAVSFYATLRSWWSKDPLLYVVTPIFVSGMIKYGERVWVLWLASSNKFRDSANQERIHLQRQIDTKLRNWIEDVDVMTQQHIDVWVIPALLDIDKSTECIDELLGFDNILKLLFADYLVTFPTHMSSYRILQSKGASESFKLVEVELGFKFGVLFTKVMARVCWQPRFILHFINFLSSVSALLAFSLMTRNFHAYSKSDIIIWYLLLIGAIVLEVYYAILLLCSDCAVLWFSKQRKPLAVSMYRVIRSSRLLSTFRNNKRCKASMVQSELINPRMSPNEHILKFFGTSNL